MTRQDRDSNGVPVESHRDVVRNGRITLVPFLNAMRDSNNFDHSASFNFFEPHFERYGYRALPCRTPPVAPPFRALRLCLKDRQGSALRSLEPRAASAW